MIEEPLVDLLASFRRDLRAEGRSDNTYRAYSQPVRFFADWLGEQGREPVLGELRRESIQEWLAQVANRLTKGTLRTYWVGLHRFCTWLVTEGELSAHPMAGMRKPAPSDPIVPVITDDELKAWIGACKGKEFADLRDEAIIRCLLDLGVRASEICATTTETVDFERDAILVNGKGGKIRLVYFSSKTGRALDRYRRARARHRHAHLAAFWLGERGAMTPDGLRWLVDKRAQIAGITGPTNPHRFRHTYAHDFLLNGGEGQTLKRLAGWSSDAMLERYGASGADVRAEVAARRLSRGDRV
ncbi:tyrosine-type recombinase/integrase [Kutzneria albida]|uniref:Uncharacterized protein n=1 Tax=Kutzneria albida DSM 43870 TaxID=1449976 RepID=W5WPR4_9PSEU|nr:tyrosine-type recombinase/integrase [Kutzneria albida]AHI00145.1 hypothetical protein KALB_6786 [Kutzneria albida DSM 43870]